jgi:hypothetical protein
MALGVMGWYWGVKWDGNGNENLDPWIDGTAQDTCAEANHRLFLCHSAC